MASENLASNTITGETLAPAADLEEYGAMIVRELDKAEADLEDGDNQPFSGMSADVMRDIAHLRNRQFDMFRRHVEIEQVYKIQNAASDGNDVQRMTFSGIATTMRKKESATAGLLNRLADFDAQLRAVMDKFDNSTASNTPADSHLPEIDLSTSHKTTNASQSRSSHERKVEPSGNRQAQSLPTPSTNNPPQSALKTGHLRSPDDSI